MWSLCRSTGDLISREAPHCDRDLASALDLHACSSFFVSSRFTAFSTAHLCSSIHIERICCGWYTVPVPARNQGKAREGPTYVKVNCVVYCVIAKIITCQVSSVNMAHRKTCSESCVYLCGFWQGPRRCIFGYLGFCRYLVSEPYIAFRLSGSASCAFNLA